MTTGMIIMDNQIATTLRTKARAAFPRNMSHQKIEDTAEGALMAMQWLRLKGLKNGMASRPRSEEPRML